MMNFIILILSIVLIGVIIVYSPKTKHEETDIGYAKASDVYNKLLTNDNNLFKLMTDFSQPVDLLGPEGADTTTVETTDLTLIDRILIT